MCVYIIIISVLADIDNDTDIYIDTYIAIKKRHRDNSDNDIDIDIYIGAKKRHRDNSDIDIYIYIGAKKDINDLCWCLCVCVVCVRVCVETAGKQHHNNNETTDKRTMFSMTN